MWQLYTIHLFLFCGVAFGDVESSKSNQYMDEVLTDILPNEAKFSNVDPAELSPFTTSNNESWGLFNVKIKLKYFNGVMTGLLKAKRAGDCSPLYRLRINTTVNCMLVFDDIKVRYPGSIKYGKLPSKSITGFANITTTYVMIDITASNNGKVPYLQRVLFTRIGTVNPRFTGIGLMNSKLKKWAEKGFVTNVRNEFLNVLNLNWGPALSRAVSHVAFPTR